MQKDAVYYVPCGWVVAERALQGPLIFGMRKSLFFQGTQHQEMYAVSREMLSAGGSDVSKMVQIAELMGPLTT